MPTLNLQVGASFDDGYSYNGDLDVFAYYVLMGTFAGEDSNRTGYRFTGVSGLSGATINSAVLTFRAYVSDTGADLIGDWYAHDVEAPSTFSTGADINGRALTTATVEGDGPDFGDWTEGQDYTFTDDGVNYIKGIIQELADSYDPSAIAMLWVRTSGDAERLPVSWDYNSSLAAKLDIDYTAGAVVVLDWLGQLPGPLRLPLPVTHTEPDLTFEDALHRPFAIAWLRQPPDPTLPPKPVTHTQPILVFEDALHRPFAIAWLRQQLDPMLPVPPRPPTQPTLVFEDALHRPFVIAWLRQQLDPMLPVPPRPPTQPILVFEDALHRPFAIAWLRQQVDPMWPVPPRPPTQPVLVFEDALHRPVAIAWLRQQVDPMRPVAPRPPTQPVLVFEDALHRPFVIAWLSQLPDPLRRLPQPLWAPIELPWVPPPVPPVVPPPAGVVGVFGPRVQTIRPRVIPY